MLSYEYSIYFKLFSIFDDKSSLVWMLNDLNYVLTIDPSFQNVRSAVGKKYLLVKKQKGIYLMY